MKISKDLALELTEGYSKNEEIENFIVIDPGEWVDDGKYSFKETIVQNKDTKQFYSISDSRSGSYYTDYRYDSEDWKDQVSLTPVKPVEKIVIVYEGKPKVKIQHAAYNPLTKQLTGTIIDHPRTELNGNFCQTSRVINIDGDRVETMNTVYKVQSWVASQQIGATDVNEAQMP